MRYLRVNYRKTGGGIADDYESAIVLLRQTLEHNSESGGVVTFSMNGYGHPDWVEVFVAGIVSVTFVHMRCSWEDAATVVYMTVQGWTACFNSLDTTCSMPYYILALIASR